MINWDNIKDLAIGGATNELQRTLNEAHREVLSMEQELLSLNKRIWELEQQLEDKSQFKYDDNDQMMYRQTEEGKREGPYCPPCMQIRGLKVRMRKYSEGYGGGWICPDSGCSYNP